MTKISAKNNRSNHIAISLDVLKLLTTSKMKIQSSNIQVKLKVKVKVISKMKIQSSNMKT